MAAAADYSDGQRWRFAVACDVLSRRVRVDAEAAACKTTAPAHPHFPAAVPVATMLLMPGADITPDVGTETEAAPAPATMSIRYAGRVLVLGDILEDRAAEIIRAATRKNEQSSVGLVDIMPVARKESLRLFMAKRRERLASKAPYSAPRQTSSPSKSREKDTEAGCWLGLGISGGSPSLSTSWTD